MNFRLMPVLAVALACWLFAGSAAAQWTWTPQTGRWVNLKRLPKESPELQVEYARGLMLAGDMRKAYRETTKFSQFYADSDVADENQFLRAEILQAQGDYVKAARNFQQVISAHPDTDLYDAAIAKQYEIGDQLYELGQQKIQKRWNPLRERPLQRAIDVYATVIENQPFTAEAAEAQYKLGLCHYARKEYTEATFEYNRVIEDYPDSPWVDDATHDVAVAYYDGARPPEYDQTPSQLAVKAIDRFEERFPGDSRNGELQQKRQEMRARIALSRLQIAKFYAKRREFAAARIYYELISKEYADTPSAAEAQTWLDTHPGVPSVRDHYAGRAS